MKSHFLGKDIQNKLLYTSSRQQTRQVNSWRLRTGKSLVFNFVIVILYKHIFVKSVLYFRKSFIRYTLLQITIFFLQVELDSCLHKVTLELFCLLPRDCWWRQGNNINLLRSSDITGNYTLSSTNNVKLKKFIAVTRGEHLFY